MEYINLEIRIVSRGQINLAKLGLVVNTSKGQRYARWTVSPTGATYTYWSLLVFPKGDYSVTYDEAALGDAYITWKEV